MLSIVRNWALLTLATAWDAVEDRRVWATFLKSRKNIFMPLSEQDSIRSLESETPLSIFIDYILLSAISFMSCPF